MVTYNPSVKGWNFPMQEAAESGQRKRCHEQRLLNTVSPTVLPSSPVFGGKVRKKPSDNTVIVLPPQAMLLFLTPRWAVLAPGRHRQGLPPLAGKPQGKGGKVPLFSRRPRSTPALQPPESFLMEQRGMSRAATHLVSFVHGEPKASNMDRLLAFCPTTCLLV